MEAFQGSEWDPRLKPSGEDPFETISTASDSRGDFIPLEFQPLSLYDSVLHSIGAVEAARDTTVPISLKPKTRTRVFSSVK